MNNLIVITHKSTGERRHFYGDVSLHASNSVVSVKHHFLGNIYMSDGFDRKLYFADIEDLDDEDLL